VAFLGAVSLFFILNAPPWFISLIIIPLVAGMIFFGFLLVLGKFSSRNKYIIIILNMLHEIKRASLTPRSLGLLGISSVGSWFLDILACVAVVNMFEQKIPFAIVVLAVVIGNLVKAVPLTPGGIGTYEYALYTTFLLAGIAPPIATLIAVIDHLIKNMVTLVGGVISIYYFGDWVVPSIKEALAEKFGGGERSDS
jgi:uncharacterized protein (TIRG00374 family)